MRNVGLLQLVPCFLNHRLCDLSPCFQHDLKKIFWLSKYPQGNCSWLINSLGFRKVGSVYKQLWFALQFIMKTEKREEDKNHPCACAQPREIQISRPVDACVKVSVRSDIPTDCGSMWQMGASLSLPRALPASFHPALPHLSWDENCKINRAKWSCHGSHWVSLLSAAAIKPLTPLSPCLPLSSFNNLHCSCPHYSTQRNTAALIHRSLLELQKLKDNDKQ